MDFTYLFILVAVLLISPFVLTLASSQKKESKKHLKLVFISILSIQIFLGFFNWESFGGFGRSGFELALTYPNSLLGFFFIISIIQIILLILNKSFNTLVAILNFVNSFVVFMGMIRLSNILGFQAVSLPPIGAVFLVLFGNVLTLAYINKDQNILKKYIK